MSASKQTTRRPSSPKADLSAVRNEFNQILWGSEDRIRLGKMDDCELSKLAHDSEIMAAKARYVLWRRMELKHSGN